MKRTVTLSDIAGVLDAADLRDSAGDTPELTITGVAQDSRDVRAGDVFLAWAGVQADGHDFLSDAVRAGAVAAIVERRMDTVAVPQLVVRNGRIAAALVADFVHGSPWRRMRMTAVTGTNGKTTTTLLIRWLLASEGPSAALGTLGLTEPDGTVRAGTENLTTPGPAQLASWLDDLESAGVRSVTLEASSHALSQFRLDGVRFDTAVFTNLTQDHLDYHGDMESYVAAKRRLVTLLADDGVAVVNADDPAWTDLGAGRTITYGVEAGADLRATDIEPGTTNTRFDLRYGAERASVELPLVGAFNVENALGAAGAAIAAGMTLSDVARRMAEAPQVPGRLERVAGTLPCAVLIDYAHTPDALRRVLEVVRPLTRGRVVAVFGAGGDRDRAKRSHMGRAAADMADLVIVTSDNPRTEDPEAIIDEIVVGLEGREYLRESDRRAAVFKALDLARAEDVIVLAGKGHETYQVLGTEKVPFDEREIVREWAEGRAA